MEEQNVLDGTQEQVVDVPNEQAVAEVETEVVESEDVKVESEVATEQQEEVEKVEEKPKQSKEDNAKFAEQRRKYEAEIEVAKQEARDKWVDEKFGESHKIHTEAEYNALKALQDRNKEIAAMTKDGKMDRQTASEVIEARRIKAEVEAQKKEAEAKAQKDEKVKEEGLEFLSYFKKVNGRAWDSDTDKLPQEVIDAVNKGERPKYAYMEYRETQNKKAQEVASNNAKIKETETGSVVGNGANTPKVFTAKQVRLMSQSEVNKNIDAIEKSMKDW